MEAEITELSHAEQIAANLELKRLKKKLEAQERLKQSNALLFYEPHRKQDLFHANGDVRWRFVRTGNRWGKSQCGAAEDVAWALGERPWYKEGDKRRGVGIPKRATKGVILIYDWSKAKEIFTNQDKGNLGKLFQWIPKDAFAGVEKTNSGDISVIKIKSKWGGISVIHLHTVKSFMQNPMAHESSNWDYVHVDEPIPEAMWKAYLRGLTDSKGSAWFLCTPLNEPWITDFFLPHRHVVVDEKDGTKFSPKDKSERYVIIGSTYDNTFLDQTAIAEFEGELTKEERECRLYGNPLVLGGLVYSRFDRTQNIYHEVPKGWETKHKPPHEYTVRYAIDPHPRTPDAVLFAATAPTGEVMFFAEYFKRQDPKELARAILEVTEGCHVHSAIMDPAGFIENPITGTTYADELALYGVFLEKASKDLARGIVETNAALGECMREGHRKMQFCDDLYETLYEFDRYEWDSKRLNKPVDKDDHMMENLYRLVVHGLDFVPRQDGSPDHFPQAEIGDIDSSYVYD